MRSHRPTSVRHILTGVLACTVSSTWTPLSVSGQTPAAQVPPALATALLATRNFGVASNVQYFVDSPPPGWQATGLPPVKAPVLGGMSADGMLVTVFTDTTKRMLSAYRQTLDSAGWAQPSYAEERGGFVESSTPNGPMVRFVGSTVCHGTESASVTPGSGGPLSGIVVVAVQLYNRQCDPADRIRNIPRTLAIPVLMAPPQSLWRGTSTGGGGDYVALSAQYQDATTPPPAMLAHFATQLIDAGWTPAESAERERFAARMFDARDAESREWTGALTVTASGKVRVVTLTMSRTNPNMLR